MIIIDAEAIIAAATQHGKDSGESDHEVGDLREVVRLMWSLLCPLQMEAMVANATIREQLELGGVNVDRIAPPIAPVESDTGSLTSLVEQAIIDWTQFDNDEEVSGADMVEYFAEFRRKARNKLAAKAIRDRKDAEISRSTDRWQFHPQGDANDYRLVTVGNRWIIAFSQNGELWAPEQEAVAARIVASVNACQGIPTSALEADVVNKLRAGLDKMWAFAGKLQEKHGMDGGDTMTDEEHREWQDVGGHANHVLNLAKHGKGA
ncbi:MAG: hypothetical protein F8N36_13885 [Desulfovibrio sp.]|uniref:hypothetical protein n=1 Tax=Desulfovibrio sp. TaxID=885 RepID=UPI00135EB8FB|nr:hypothetical protein [Desulfovibrio sp.]MTJ93929.1 hypothetical protein [Desulfovibrio sp.]